MLVPEMKVSGITGSHILLNICFLKERKKDQQGELQLRSNLRGYLNAFTSKEHTCYYGRGLAEHIEKTFDVISDMIQQPAFKPIEIKKESSVVIDELNDIEDNPEELIFDKFEEIIFAGNSLSLPIIGSEKNIKNFSQFDLFNFVKEKYGSNRLIISASGAVEHDKLLKLTDKFFNVELGRAGIKRKHYSISVQPSKIRTYR